MTHYDLIQEIRGYANDGNQWYKENLYNSVQKLADDLYSTDSHFLFELIQNAEDNSYEAQEPSLTFHLVSSRYSDLTFGAEHALIVYNNEVGFQHKNVKALCAVGKSTKSKTQGYIGEKGIGFKSVFRVTSCPHVFSNGFRFCLPEKHQETGLGYIVPDWIEYPPKDIAPNGTTIILPLNKPEFGFDSICRMLQEFDSDTILFLSKLKTLSLKVENQFERTINKHDAAFPCITIAVTETVEGKVDNTVEEFLIYQKIVDKPDHISHQERQGINQREVSIACLLNSDPDLFGKLFAYLPVKDETGLPFAINADFLLTSSREDVHTGEEWNLWLRDCVADVFVEAFEQWVTIERYQTEIFKFIPLQANNSFLSPLVKDIQQRLRERAIIPTTPDGQLAVPSATQTAPTALYDLLVGSEYPQPLLEKRLAAQSLLQWAKQLRVLGVQVFDKRSILGALEDEKWVAQHDYEWLLALYRFLDSKIYGDEQLANLAIVPTVLGGQKRYSCSKEGPIFFKISDVDLPLIGECPSCVTLQFGTVAPEFYALLSRDEALYKWTKLRLGISDFSRQSYAEQTATWLFQNHKVLSDKELLDVTCYLAEFQHSLPKIYIPVLLADGTRMINMTEFVAPAKLNPESGWQNIFITANDRSHFHALSDRYVFDDSKKTQSVLSLFDYELYPDFRRETVKPYYSNRNSYFRDGLDGLLSNQEKQLAKTAWSSSAVSRREDVQLSRIVVPSSFSSVDERFSRSLLGWIRYHYADLRLDEIEHHLFTFSTYEYWGTVTWPNGDMEKESRIIDFMKTARWLPTTNGLVSPKEAFLPTEGTKEILGDTVAYFSEKLPRAVIEFLGINTEINISRLLSILTHHSTEGTGSIDLATRIYHALSARQFTSSQLQRQPLIYVGHQHGWVSGKDVVWNDESESLGNDFIYLEKIYPNNLRAFFANCMGVKISVDDEAFANRWLRLQDETDREPAEVEKILATIYRKLLPICRLSEDEQPGWWGNFVKQAQIWTQHDTFEDPNTVFVPDDAELRDVCKGFDLAYAWRPRGDSFADWKELYRALSVSYLSESLRCELNEEIEYEWVDEPEFLTDAAKILILAWLYDQQRTQFDSLAEEGVVDILLSTDEVLATDLHVHYELGDQSTIVPSSCFWDVEECLLLLGDSSDLPMKNRIAHALAQRLMGYQPYKELSTWIELVLGERSEAWRLEERSFRIPPAVKEWQKERKKFDAVSDHEAEANKVSTKTQPPLETSPATEKPSTNGVSPAPDMVSEQDESPTPEQNDSPTEMQPIPSMPDTKPEFPHRPVKNPERRGTRRRQHVREQPVKTYERRDGSVRTSANGVEKQTYLREHYTNADDEMVCQICQEEMPFYKRNGEYYFEAVEALSNITKEDAASYLALCPVCAAKYTEFVKRDEMQWSQVEAQLRAIDSSEETEIALMLDTTSTLRFVEAHLFDLQYLLEQDDDGRQVVS